VIKILALSGKAGSGKDTAFRLIEGVYGNQVHRVAFADVLKDKTSTLFSIPRTHFDSLSLKEQPLKQYPVVSTDPFSSIIINLLLATGSIKRLDGTITKDINGGGHHTPRTLAILIGSVMRSIDPHHWVRAAYDKMSPDKLNIITDLRYESELDILTKMSPHTLSLRIERDNLVSHSNDASETNLDHYPFDFYVRNNSHLVDYSGSLIAIMFEAMGYFDKLKKRGDP
jgi:hypothetical protein